MENKYLIKIKMSKKHDEHYKHFSLKNKLANFEFQQYNHMVRRRSRIY